MKQVELRNNILELKNNTLYVVTKDTIIDTIKVVDSPFQITIQLNENATLTCGAVIKIENIIGNILIKNSNKTSCKIKLGIIAQGKNHLTINNTIYQNENESDILVRVIGEENSNTTIKTIGHILENTKDNKFTENVRYLNEEDSFIECIPELQISSNACEANHFVTIASIPEETIFYLETKGMSESIARNLIRTCFIQNMQIRKEEEDEH